MGQLGGKAIGLLIQSFSARSEHIFVLIVTMFLCNDLRRLHSPNIPGGTMALLHNPVFILSVYTRGVRVSFNTYFGSICLCSAIALTYCFTVCIVLYSFLCSQTLNIDSVSYTYVDRGGCLEAVLEKLRVLISLASIQSKETTD